MIKQSRMNECDTWTTLIRVPKPAPADGQPPEEPNPDVSVADSDADGNFSLLDVDPGMYEIVVTKRGYLPAVEKVSVDAAVDDVRVTLTTVTFNLAGVARAAAAAGGVLPGAQVTLSRGDDEARPPLHAHRITCIIRRSHVRSDVSVSSFAHQ